MLSECLLVNTDGSVFFFVQVFYDGNVFDRKKDECSMNFLNSVPFKQ